MGYMGFYGIYGIFFVKIGDFMGFYPLVNKQLDPENSTFLMETSLPTPMTARVYVNLPEGTQFYHGI